MEGVYKVLSEYWFLDYYRVLKIRSNGKYLLSIDVYRRGFPFEPSYRECVMDDKYCLLYHEYPIDRVGIDGVERVVITGVKAGDRYETVNVRWVLSIDPGYDLIEEIFYRSWEVIGCRRPVDPWRDPCSGE